MQLNMIDNRIALLDTAERLAMQDNNPKNNRENYNMIMRCISEKIKLWDEKLAIQASGRKEVA